MAERRCLCPNDIGETHGKSLPHSCRHLFLPGVRVYAAVSYTHLDVYKRQPPSMVIRLRLVPGIMATHWSAPTVSALPGVRLAMEAPESPSLERPSLVRQAQYARITPVSYTHLDVYKRQVPWDSPQVEILNT